MAFSEAIATSCPIPDAGITTREVFSAARQVHLGEDYQIDTNASLPEVLEYGWIISVVVGRGRPIEYHLPNSKRVMSITCEVTYLKRMRRNFIEQVP